MPDGHPSSPFEADGSRKAAVVIPRASDRPADDEPGRHSDEPPALPDSRASAEPFTDTQWADHVQEVSDRLEQARADGQATDERYTVDPDREVWSTERRAAQTAIVDDLYQQAAGVPNERRAVIAGGLPGAGKTTILEHCAGIDRSQFLTVNPDEVKAEMARRGLIPSVAGLSPMEASDLAHEESSHVAKRLARRAQADGKNVIWDITMSSVSYAEGRIRDLRANGYTDIRGVFVDLPPEISAARADGRHRKDEQDYRAGMGEGGRFIPADVIMANRDSRWGSTNRGAFEQIKDSLDGWSVYDNSVDGRAPVLVDSSDIKERNP